MHPGIIIIVPNVTPVLQRELFQAALDHIRARDLTNTVVEIKYVGDRIACSDDNGVRIRGGRVVRPGLHGDPICAIVGDDVMPISISSRPGDGIDSMSGAGINDIVNKSRS